MFGFLCNFLHNVVTSRGVYTREPGSGIRDRNGPEFFRIPVPGSRFPIFMRLAIQLFGVVALSVSLDGQNIEQTAPGSRPPAQIVHQFDGLGVGFEGPQGTANLRNPSDNSLAVGPDHVVQTVNSRMAIFTKQGRRYPDTGRVLYGPVNTNNVFRGFGGTCEARNNGDAVVRYDQLARRWLIVMPIFSRAAERADHPPVWTARAAAYESPSGVANQPGAAAPLFRPPASATSATVHECDRCGTRCTRCTREGPVFNVLRNQRQ